MPPMVFGKRAIGNRKGCKYVFRSEDVFELLYNENHLYGDNHEFLFQPSGKGKQKEKKLIRLF